MQPTRRVLAPLVALLALLLLGPAPAVGAADDTGSQTDTVDDVPDAIGTSEDEADIEETASDGETGSDDAAAHLRAEVLTDFPVQLGGGLLFEFPGVFRLSTSVGVLPTGYLKVANDVLVPLVDEYEQRSADLVEDILQSSMVWRAHAGLRPIPDLGLYIHTGYSLVTLGGTATTAGEFIYFVETEFPKRAEDRFRNQYGDEELEVHSTLHQWDIEVGYDWALAKHLRLRTALGWSYTFAASTTMEAQFQADRPEVQETIDALEAAGEAYLNDTYRSSIHPPYLSLSLGWRFF